MTVMNDIRRTLENKLTSISGVPQIAYENYRYDFNEGVSFVKASFLPSSSRPSVTGPDPRVRYQGVFDMLVCVPEGEGSGPAQTIVDLLLTQFKPHEHETYLGFTVSIDYSESAPGYFDSPFYCVPVSVGWHTYN